MKNSFSNIVRLMEFIGIIFFVLGLLVLYILYSTGNLTKQRLYLLGQVLRGEMKEETATRIEDIRAEWEKLRSATEEKDKFLTQKSLDLERFEGMLNAMKSEIEREKTNLELEKEKLRKEKEAMLVRREVKTPEAEKVFKSNIAIFSKMSAEDIVKIMKEWDDETIRKYLRAMKPSKANEIINILSEDARFTKPDEYGIRRLDNILGEAKKGLK